MSGFKTTIKQPQRLSALYYHLVPTVLEGVSVDKEQGLFLLTALGSLAGSLQLKINEEKRKHTNLLRTPLCDREPS